MAFWRVSRLVEAIAEAGRNHPALALLVLIAIGIGVALWFLQMTP
jgi:lipopolysaccharide export LptBFGC system permease protein LptF